jgi:maleylacetoacetate isomerase
VSTPLRLAHYWRSSSSWRVRWALAIKGLAWESVPVNLLESAQNAEAYRAVSPMGLVPCLWIDGRPLTESLPIIELLDERWPDPPLLPREGWARARARQLAEMINAGTQPLGNLSVLKAIGDGEAQRAWAQRWIKRGLDAYEQELAQVEQELGRGRFSVGDHVTIADLCLIPQLYNARRQALTLDGYPRILAIEAAALATEAAQSAHPDRFAPSGG